MRIVLLALLLGLSTACAKGFDVKGAPGFVEVHEKSSAYDYRAIVPDGVAVAVRSVPVEDGTDTAFWERAILLRMRELDGYALTSSSDVKSNDGLVGRELDFGHDEQCKPYTYRVRLFVKGDKLVLAEAGGASEEMERWRPSVDWMLSSVRAR
jgi:hypothetical protein